MGFWKKTYKFVGSWCARYLYMLYDIWRYIVVPKWLQMEGDLALSSSASALQKKGNLWSSRADGQINAIFLGYKLINPNACWWNPRQSICSPTIVYTHVTHLLFLVTSSHVTCVKRLSVCLIPLFSWLGRSNLWNVFEYGHGDCQSKWIKTYEIIWFFIWFFIWHFFSCRDEDPASNFPGSALRVATRSPCARRPEPPLEPQRPTRRRSPDAFWGSRVGWNHGSPSHPWD